MIDYPDFQRICREERLAECYIEKIWESRLSYAAKTGRDPARVVTPESLRQTIRMLVERWPVLAQEPS